MSEIKAAIAYFEDAIWESDEIIEECSDDLQKELTEQKKHFEVALAALQEKSEPRHLTLDELRQMDGQPVYLVSGAGAVCSFSGWAIVGRYYDNTLALYVPENVYYEAAIKHGTVIAYDRPPGGEGR